MRNLAKKMRVNGAKAIAMKKSHKEFYEKLKGKHSIDRSKYLRIQILLLCHSGLNNAEVTRETGVTLKTVKTYKRWKDMRKEGQKVEVLRSEKNTNMFVMVQVL